MVSISTGERASRLQRRSPNGKPPLRPRCLNISVICASYLFLFLTWQVLGACGQRSSGSLSQCSRKTSAQSKKVLGTGWAAFPRSEALGIPASGTCGMLGANMILDLFRFWRGSSKESSSQNDGGELEMTSIGEMLRN